MIVYRCKGKQIDFSVQIKWKKSSFLCVKYLFDKYKGVLLSY